ncbi:MAG: alpha/beta hydrolase [Pseudomonadota bacterium]
MSAIPESEQPEYLITLVHGTFAHKAPWAWDYRSDFRSYLRENLPGNVKFRCCAWSGRNRNRDRIHAAERLKKRLERQSRLYPNAKKIVIGHSHGGNVAIRAAAEFDSGRNLLAVVGMNTPWICATRRNTLQLSFFLGIFSFIALELWLLSRASLTTEQSSWWVQALSGLAVGAVLMLVAFLVIYKGSAVYKWMMGKREKLIKTLQPAPLHNTPVLCVWGGDDEVRNAFTVLEAVENIPFLLLHWVGLSVIAILIIAGIEMGYLPQLVDFVTKEMDGSFNVWMQDKFFVVASATIYLTLTMYALILLIYVVNVVLRLLPVGVAVANFYHSAFVHLSFTLVPVTAKHTDFREVDTNLNFLSHSSVYEDEKSLEEVCRWIIARSKN